MSDRDVKTWMASMELDVSDAASVFLLVDKDGDGTLTPEELVQGVALLKGAARSIDLHMLRREVVSTAHRTRRLNKCAKTLVHRSGRIFWGWRRPLKSARTSESLCSCNIYVFYVSPQMRTRRRFNCQFPLVTSRLWAALGASRSTCR
ncbi:unnamed protein product, partial [Prorocentrum cordatum]